MYPWNRDSDEVDQSEPLHSKEPKKKAKHVQISNETELIESLAIQKCEQNITLAWSLEQCSPL